MSNIIVNNLSVAGASAANDIGAAVGADTNHKIQTLLGTTDNELLKLEQVVASGIDAIANGSVYKRTLIAEAEKVTAIVASGIDAIANGGVYKRTLIAEAEKVTAIVASGIDAIADGSVYKRVSASGSVDVNNIVAASGVTTGDRLLTLVRAATTGNKVAGYLPKYASVGGAIALNVDAIAFSATQVASSDPNAMDDYEEGAWTPRLWFGATEVAAYTSQIGTYTKNGRHVYISGYIETLTKGAGTGSVSITGNSFSATSRSEGLTYFDIFSGKQMTGLVTGGAILARIAVSSIVDFFVQGTTGHINMTEAKFIDTSRIEFSLEFDV